MRKMLLIVGSVIIVCSAVAGSLLWGAIYRERQAHAFLKTLSDVKIGSTTSKEFDKSMSDFISFKSSSVATACHADKCYQGVGYGIDNRAWGKYLIFPETNLAVGVYFDPKNVIRGGIVTLDRYDVASATIEFWSSSTATSSTPKPIQSGRTNYGHLILDQEELQQLTRMSLSCFSSWYGCNTGEKLLSESN